MNNLIKNAETVKNNHPLVDPDKRRVIHRIREKLRSLGEHKTWLSGEDDQFMRLLAVDILDYFTQDEEYVIKSSAQSVIRLLLNSCSRWEEEAGL